MGLAEDLSCFRGTAVSAYGNEAELMPRRVGRVVNRAEVAALVVVGVGDADEMPPFSVPGFMLVRAPVQG